MFKNKEDFKRSYVDRLVKEYGCTLDQVHPTEMYASLGEMVRVYAGENWKESKEAVSKSHAKQVYYFSMEFLLGRMLTNNLQNLGIYDMVVQGLKELGIKYSDIVRLESDAGLGNGGLGRLAACFMDSAASENYAVNGNCIRYQCGLFRQIIDKDGNQVEVPDMWLRYGNPWEVRKPKHSVDVKFYGNIAVYNNENGQLVFDHQNAEHVLAVPYDVPMIGAHTKMTNTLRLWSAEPADISPRGEDYRQYLSEVSQICLNVYPDDSTEEGKYLRLKQQYFFVCAGIDSMVRSHLKTYSTLDNLAEKVGVQLNDTHPVLAIPELMRVLMDTYGYEWNQAMEITTNVMAYTNHTVMSEALEKWPCVYIQKLLPRIYMIIEEMDRRFCDKVNQEYPGSVEMLKKTRIIGEDGMVRMANLAVIGSHSVNGVAKIHSQILKDSVFHEFYTMTPKRFGNKTNGITHRRWLMYSNPELRKLLDKTIGEGYETHPEQLSKLMKYVDSGKVQKEFLAVKRKRKELLANRIYDATGYKVDPDSIFDTQAKRLHAYKRQLLSILYVIYLYQECKKYPDKPMTKRTFLYAAKAAPSYVFAKKVIKLINCVAHVINTDPVAQGKLSVLFLPNYNVSHSEFLMNASDVSEQISLAGTEASGTGNMKFMMNGAITLGTLDGANVEIDQLVGRKNDVIFGLTVQEVEKLRPSYQAQDYYNKDERIRNILGTLIDGTWNGDPNDFRMIYDELLVQNDTYFVLADFDAYVKAQETIEKKYSDPAGWAKSCLINIAQSGYFSSDRTIEEYAKDIWHIEPIKFR